jgi:dTDP-4-dehydrorhamnose reductase
LRIVLLGATGMLGHKLWQRLPDQFSDVYAVIRRSRADPLNHGLFLDRPVVDGVDVSDFSTVRKVLERLRPDVVVNCVGVTKRREAATDPVPSIALNGLLPHQLAGWGQEHDCRLIHFSTDCVFNGASGGYTEDSLTDADDLYGRTKALGETAAPNALTLRSSFIGRELANGTELLEWCLAQRGRTIRGFRGALYTGVSSIYLADLVADILVRNPGLNGLYHLASEVVSKYDLLCLAREKFGIQVTIEPDDTYVCKRDLNGERLSAKLGTSPPTWAQMMADLAADPTPYDQWRQQDAVQNA